MRMTTRNERGVALPLAVVIMVIAAILIVAMTSAAFNSRDRASDARDRIAGSGPAEEGVAIIQRLLTANEIGEQTGFAVTRESLTKYVESEDGGSASCGSSTPLCLLDNSATTYKEIDARGMTGHEVTVRRIAEGEDGDEYRFWQVMAISPPRYGRQTDGGQYMSPGGRMVVYVRGWSSTDPEGKNLLQNRPTILRAELRPPRFSDYQMVVDGKMRLGQGVHVNGRIHSNGYPHSLFNIYQDQAAQIDVSTASCESFARVSTAKDSANTSIAGSCGTHYEGQGHRISVLDVIRDIVQIKDKYCTPPPGLQINVICPTSAGTDPVQVTLGTSVSAGGETADAVNHRLDDPSSGTMGAVVILDRAAIVTGSLPGNARATIIVHNSEENEVLDQAPSIIVRHSVGADESATTSSLGLIADADIIADEEEGCPTAIRGAVIARGGTIARLPKYSLPIDINPHFCSSFTLTGSMSTHMNFALALNNGTGISSGYQERKFEYDERLFHNPPPLFPVTGPWEVINSSPANLDCFGTAATPVLDEERPECI